MVTPNYKDSSIVNLMSSIKKGLGGKHSYRELKKLPAKDLKSSKNVVLFVVDGFGYSFLEKNAKGTIFEDKLNGGITSVFPSTTAAAITTFSTGLPPSQHGFTGWFIHLKELGTISAVLPFHPRIGRSSFTEANIKYSDITNAKGFSTGLKVESHIILHKALSNTHFTNQILKAKSKITSYNTFEGLFRQASRVVKSNKKKKFVYVYWSGFDYSAHTYGINSKETKAHFKDLCSNIEKLIKNLEGTNTKLIITADHGLVDTTKKTWIQLKDHPKLDECLSLPLCGEPRAAFCYVKPEKVKDFKAYVKTKLSKYCTLHKSSDLIKKNYFGIGKADPRLFDRVGDYTLIMKENYIIRDKMLYENQHKLIGCHGGNSRDEMLVPLAVFDL